MAVTGLGDAPLRSGWYLLDFGRGHTALMYAQVAQPNKGDTSPLHTVMDDFFFEAAAVAGTPYYYQWRRRTA